MDINLWEVHLAGMGFQTEDITKFAVIPATMPIKEYISTTTVTALQAGKLNGVDCSGLYHDGSRILNTYTNKPIHTNITKAEHLALENLRKDKDCIIVTADKGVALVVMDKQNTSQNVKSSYKTTLQRHISNYPQRTQYNYA